MLETLLGTLFSNLEISEMLKKIQWATETLEWCLTGQAALSTKNGTDQQEDRHG